MSYCPTHAHSCYSVRDSIIKIEDYAKRCKELKIEAACITDHGCLHGAYKFYKEFKKNGIKPIIGQEFYYADDITDKGHNYHLVLLAKNNEGFKDLCRLSTIAFQDGFYKKPRVDKAILKQYSENVICTTACVFGKAQQLFLNNDVDAAKQEITDLKDIFGDSFYLEIASHEMEDEDKVRDFFREIGESMKIKVLPATDSHYVYAEDKPIHNIFKQLAYGTVGMEDDGFPGTGYHIWSAEEMQAKFLQSEVDTTLEIAERCNVSFNFSGYYLPEFECPAGTDSYTYLYALSQKGLEAKGLQNDKAYVDRLDYEMSQLHLTQLEDYFLIVMDYIVWCKKAGIPVGPGRGSGAGSLVSYLIGITSVDPLEYDLMFARCINPGRALQYDFGI